MGMEADEVVQADAQLQINIVNASISVWEHSTSTPAEGQQADMSTTSAAVQSPPAACLPILSNAIIKMRLIFLSSAGICPAFKTQCHAEFICLKDLKNKAPPDCGDEIQVAETPEREYVRNLISSMVERNSLVHSIQEKLLAVRKIAQGLDGEGDLATSPLRLLPSTCKGMHKFCKVEVKNFLQLSCCFYFKAVLADTTTVES